MSAFVQVGCPRSREAVGIEAVLTQQLPKGAPILAYSPRRFGKGITLNLLPAAKIAHFQVQYTVASAWRGPQIYEKR